MKIFENKKLKGAVSIFLIIITIPSLLFSAVLIDGSRVASARAMTQEATDLAAASVLADYNEDLKDQFGLFAMEGKTKEELEAVFKESLNATLLAYGLDGDEAYSERLWEIMKTALTGQKSYMGESFLNLYDFSLEESSVEPMYALANQAVLENQMVEYAKFRGIYIMADRLDFLRNLDQAKEEGRKNQETAEAMENKMDADEKNADADRALGELRAEVETLMDRINATGMCAQVYFNALEAKLKELQIDNTDSEESLTDTQKENVKLYEHAQSEFAACAESACNQAEAVLKKAEEAMDEAKTAIARLEEFQKENQAKADGNEDIASLIQDAEDNIKRYREVYIPAIESIQNDAVIRQMAEDSQIKKDLTDTMDDIHKAAVKYQEEIEEMKKKAEENGQEPEPVEEYFYYYLYNGEKTTDAQAVRSGGDFSYESGVLIHIAYFLNEKWDTNELNPAKNYSPKEGSEINRNFAKNQSKTEMNADTGLEGEEERRSVPDEIYKSRPSVMFEGEKGTGVNTDFYNEDGNLGASKSIMSQGKNSMVLGLAETVRDDVLGLSYMFGTFKTRLTGVNKFSSEGMTQADKDSFYMPKWRYAHSEGETDMRFTPKKDRETVLRSEIEYLVYGNKSDAANETAVYATIFAERLANNIIALYGEKTVVNPACHEAAASACAITAGVIPEIVYFWIFLTAWSVAETVIEMDYLISGGYKIPLFKKPYNVLLNKFPYAGGEGLISNYGTKGIFVSYEDYLLIMLLLKGREKRVMRTADLIEMNMRTNGQPEFRMAEAYTYLRADSALSIRYLFGSAAPFGGFYEENGYTGRIHYNNTIYLGY